MSGDSPSLGKRGDFPEWPWRAALGLPEAKVKEKSRFLEGPWECGPGRKEGEDVTEIPTHTLSRPCRWGMASQCPPSLGCLQTIEDAKYSI